MPRNVDIDSPTVKAITFDEDLGKRTLRGIDIFSDGDLSITDIEGETVTVTIPDTAIPFRWVVQIRTVNTSGTTIAASDLLGLR